MPNKLVDILSLAFMKNLTLCVFSAERFFCN